MDSDLLTQTTQLHGQPIFLFPISNFWLSLFLFVSVCLLAQCAKTHKNQAKSNRIPPTIKSQKSQQRQRLAQDNSVQPASDQHAETTPNAPQPEVHSTQLLKEKTCIDEAKSDEDHVEVKPKPNRSDGAQKKLSSDPEKRRRREKRRIARERQKFMARDDLRERNALALDKARRKRQSKQMDGEEDNTLHEVPGRMPSLFYLTDTNDPQQDSSHVNEKTASSGTHTP